MQHASRGLEQPPGGARQAAIASLPAELRGLPLDQVELKAINMVGVDSLANLFTPDEPTPTAAATLPLDDFTGAPLAGLIDEFATQDHGLVMCVGKGGVGKTTIAAAIAVALVGRGHQVHRRILANVATPELQE